ncbi:MAG: TrmO family methyltransferase [Desulfobacterales bacterium]|nr:TrmO family methyltransferase [Desulfobacterales bacterium]
MSFLDTKLLSVGNVESEIKEISIPLKDNDLKFDPEIWSKQKSKSKITKIIINEEFEECLDGIDDFSHIIVIYLTDVPEKTRRTLKKVHPGGCSEMPLKGIFSCRSPIRPNPLAISTILLIERTGNILTVDGLDAVDQTVILDVRPYVGEAKHMLETATIAPWVSDLKQLFQK